MKKIEFKGMVRCTSPQNNADGNCEEIVNMRLDSGAWRAVGTKKAILKDADYDQVYVHKYGTFENFIGLKDGKVNWCASRVDGDVIERDQEICTVSGEVKFNHLNNILMICDESNIVKSVFSDGRYGTDTIKLPDTPMLEIIQKKFTPVSDVQTDNAYVDYSVHLGKVDEINSAKELIRGLVVKEREKYVDYTEGYAFLTATYQLFDGSETKPTPPIALEIGNYVPGLIEVTNVKHDTTDDHFTAQIRVRNMELYNVRVKATGSVPEEFREIVSKVNVYVTPVQSYYDTNGIRPDYVPSSISDYKNNIVIKRELTNEEVEKLLFYRIGSFNLLDEPKFRDIKFDNTLTTNPTLPVDTSGWLDRSGKMFTYNNRLHLYDIKQKFVESKNIGYCWYPYADPDQSNNWGHRDMAAFVYLKVDQKDVVVRYDCSLACPTSDNVMMRFPKVVSFPDSRAYKIAFYDRNRESMPLEVKLRASSTYNFAFGILDDTSVAIPATSNPVNFPTVDNYMEDNMNLIVSAAMNPYYFPPDHSYLMPGEIVNLAVNTAQISASQIGQFPVYVFTREGIYAMQVGEGKVLYSNMIPISAEVAEKGSSVLQTKYGVLFVTDKGLKVISGSEVVHFSKAVSGKLDQSYRSNNTYNHIMNHPRMGVDLTPYVSAVPFEQYVKKSVMGYDVSEDEVIVSNPAYSYSYVFSLESKTWHKITEAFTRFNRHVGLQEYKQKAIPAKARVEIGCTIKSSYMQKYLSSVEIPDLDLVLPAGKTRILVDGQNLCDFTTTEAITLKDALDRISVPKFVARFEVETSKLYLAEKSTLLSIRGNGIPSKTYRFVADSAEFLIDAKGEGENIRLKVGEQEVIYITKETDTAATIATSLAALVKEKGFETQADETGLFIYYPMPGVVGNGALEILCKPSPHVTLKATGFSGGMEEHMTKNVCDIREEEDTQIPVYLQTRPINLESFGFKKIRHFIMSGEFKPDSVKYYGLFLFASNDQMKWECVADSGFNEWVPRVVTSPIGQTYRYYVISTGGWVNPGHVVVGAELEEEEKYDNRLR